MFLLFLIVLPVSARFTSVDPKREYPNPFSYVGNNPIIATDPTGEEEYLGFDKNKQKQIAGLTDKMISDSDWGISFMGTVIRKSDILILNKRTKADMAVDFNFALLGSTMNEEWFSRDKPQDFIEATGFFQIEIKNDRPFDEQKFLSNFVHEGVHITLDTANLLAYLGILPDNVATTDYKEEFRAYTMQTEYAIGKGWKAFHINREFIESHGEQQYVHRIRAPDPLFSQKWGSRS